MARRWWSKYPGGYRIVIAVVRNPPTLVEGLSPKASYVGALAARGESLAAFDGRCIPAGCVAPRSNTPGILGGRALPAGRLARLGATPDFHHGLLEAELAAELDQPRIENLERCTPGCSVDAVDGPDRIGVQRVVRVDVDLETITVVPEDFRQPQVEPGNPVLEQRLRSHERDSHGRRRKATGQRPPERWDDFGIRRGVVRAVRRPRNILPGKREREIERDWNDSVRLVLCLPLERRHDAAVQQFLRGIDDEASIAHRSSRIEASVQPDAPRKAGVDRDTDEVVAARERPVLLRQRHIVLHLTVLRPVDIGEIAHLVAAPTGELRILRGGDAIGRVVRGPYREVVRRADLAAERAAKGVPEIAAVVVVVAAGDPDVGSQLMLSLGCDVPVGVPLAVAREDGRVDLDGIRVVLAEVLIADRRAFAIRPKVTQVAVRDVVAVGVAPTTKAVRDGPGNRTGDGSGDIVRAELRDISAGG